MKAHAVTRYVLRGILRIALTLLEPQSHMWGQTTQMSSSLSPKRDCGPKRVNGNVCHQANQFLPNCLCSDFLFEAIKSEREGTSRYYLDAAEALALSPVEFFHTDNFSMKFSAPILLGASRRQGVVGGDFTVHAGAPLDQADRINEEEDEVGSTYLLGKVGPFGSTLERVRRVCMCLATLDG